MAGSNNAYLPLGLTEEMFNSLSEQEAAIDALTEEGFHLLRLRIAAQALADALNRGSATSIPAPCVEAVEAVGLTEWGFSIFRTDYNSEQAWTAFPDKFNGMIEEQLTPANGAGIDSIRDQLQMNFVSDKARLENGNAQDIRQYCRELAELPNSLLSLRFTTVLMVDTAAMESLLTFQPKERPPETPFQEKMRGAPWVRAVDMEHEAPPEGGGDVISDGDRYHGEVKVAVSSLINDLFPIVADGRLALEELVPSESSGGVWSRSLYSLEEPRGTTVQ